MITPERLRELLHYDLVTGVFTNRINRGRARAGRVAGMPTHKGYVAIFLDGTYYEAHRLAFLYVEGRWPVEVDHWNLDRSDNRWVNLREATRGQNMANSRAHRDKESSPLKGAFFNKAKKRWFSSVRGQHLGYFSSDVEAHEAYVRAAKLVYGEFANDGKA